MLSKRNARWVQLSRHSRRGARSLLPLPCLHRSPATQCRMSAPELLNSVMMMGFYTHTMCQPVVVLERLNENDNDTLQIQNPRSLKTPPQSEPRQPAKHLGHQKGSPLEQASCRSLRSHVNNKNTRKRRFSESTSVTNIDDNKPLKFIKNTKNQDEIKKKIKATKCTSTQLKRVSLRQIKLRKNEEEKKRRKEEEMDSNEIKEIKNAVKPQNATQFKKPRPRRLVRSVYASRDKAPAESENPLVNTIRDKISEDPEKPRYNAINGEAQTETEPKRPRANSIGDQTSAEPMRPRVHSSSDEARAVPTACSHTGSNDQLRASLVSELDDTAQTPNTLDIMVTSIFSIDEQLYDMKMDLDSIQYSPSSRPPSTLPCAAPDVYSFNVETEAEGRRKPFRTNRYRQVSHNIYHPSHYVSVDSALANHNSDAIRVQITNPHLQTTVAAEPVETVVIDNDPKDEPDKPPADDAEEPLLASAGEILWGGTDIQRGALALADDDDEGHDIAVAPAFYPTKEEMRDLNNYIEKMEPVARKYGIFKIVPPRDFQPPCQLRNVQFKSTNQYVSSMYSRWGPAASEMTAIKAHLATQNVAFTRPPLFEGVEVDLVRLYNLVKEHGGLIRVIEERKWAAIAEKMQLNAHAGHVKAAVKLDKIYLKHLFPYETLSEEERTELRARVTAAWRTRYLRQRARASRPLHRQRRLLAESESSGEEPEPAELATAFLEVEDCVLPGSNMNLAQFQRVGERVRDMRFPGASADAPPHWADVERTYWRLVRSGTEHICVHGAALDTSQDALGFPAAVDAPYGNHPWNLKRLGESENNVLSSLGPTLAVTIPTLHLGMMFSTNCWHRDPHHLSWTEYMHQGPPKIWYGIADSESAVFRNAVEHLSPTAVQQKALWLPSDTVMLPPRVLAHWGVRLVRAIQAPGEYVVVLPRAYSCSISTGLTVSESLYFAGDSWLDGIDKVFAALRADAEPSMFALEALLEGVVRHPAAPLPRLLRARPLLRSLLDAEKTRRREAAMLGVRALSPREFLKENRRCSKTSWQVVRDECHVCRATLHWSKIVDVSSRVSVCLEHGLRLVQVRNPSVELGTDRLPNVEEFATILFYSDKKISHLLAELDKPI